MSKLSAWLGGVLLSITDAGIQMRQQRCVDKGRTEPSNRTPDKIVVKSKKSLKKFSKDKKRGDVIFTVSHRKNPFRGIVGPKLRREQKHVQIIKGVQIA
jgi:hypothetical protein